jgi:hypothetical protein
MTPTEYEKAVVERFKTNWPPHLFLVHHNTKLPVIKTETPRQIDIGVFEAGQSVPFLIAEAKRYGRPVDAVKAGSTIALVQDVGGLPAVMVSTSGFSLAAENHLAAEGIEFLKITLTEAGGLRWIPFIEAKFILDREYREVSGDLLEAARMGNAALFLETDLPFEEWMAVLVSGQSLFPDHYASVLKTLARVHFNDGVKYNAIALLEEAVQLDAPEIEGLLQVEYDPDTRELLYELLGPFRSAPLR